MATYSSTGSSATTSTHHPYSPSPQGSPVPTTFAIDPHMVMMQSASAHPEQSEFQEGSSSGYEYTEERGMDYNQDAEMSWEGHGMHHSMELYRMDTDTQAIVSPSPYYGAHNTMPPQSWPFPIPQPEQETRYPSSSAGHLPPRALTSYSTGRVVQSTYSSLAQALSYTDSNVASSSSSPFSPSAATSPNVTPNYSYANQYDTGHEYAHDGYFYAQPSPPSHRSSFSVDQSPSIPSQSYDPSTTSPVISAASPSYGSSPNSGMDSPDLQYPPTPPDLVPTTASTYEDNTGAVDELPSEAAAGILGELSPQEFDEFIQHALQYLSSQPPLPVNPLPPALPPPPLSPAQALPLSPHLAHAVQPLATPAIDDTHLNLLSEFPPLPTGSYMWQQLASSTPLMTPSENPPVPFVSPIQNNPYRHLLARRGSDESYTEAESPVPVPVVDDDLDKFIQIAANSERFDDNATIDEALKKLGLQNLQEKLPGMDVALMPHQVLGVAWMLDKEKGTVQGGCLADEMGLGKTVQMIATMVVNRSKDENHRSTLVIAPLALLDQWQREIEEKSNCGFKCFKYHGQGKPISKTELMKYDVVLTTYGTMSHEWPDYEKEASAKARARRRGQDYVVGEDDEDMKNQEYRTQKRKQNAGLLFQVEWYRVVADEAQNIRNRKTRMSRAINDLSSMYRWCLTGTPVVNTLTDSYGYLRFLRIRPWYDWKEFNDHIARLEKKRTNLAVKRLQAINAIFLLRRKKDSKLDGKTLVELPEKEIKLVKLEFSPEERQIYDMVERRSQARFNRFLKAGTVLKHYHRVLVLLLRLRQICAHPSLIQEDCNAFISGDEDDDDLKPVIATELTRARQVVSPEFVDKLKAKLKQEALDRIQAEKESEGNADATVDEDECPICYEPMTDAVFTACAHAFCRECIKAFITQRGKEEATTINSRIEKPCPVCRGTITEERLFLRSAFEPTEDELKPMTDDMDEDMDIDTPQLRIDKGKAKAQEPELDDSAPTCAHGEGDGPRGDLRYKGDGNSLQTAIVLDSDDEGPDQSEDKDIIFGRNNRLEPSTPEPTVSSKFLPSSKMKYMMEQIQELARTKPNEKVLVVSQWTSCLTLVSDYLTEKNIPHVKYQGDMTPAKREQAVQVFMAKEKAMVMLMSLKCGGVGLNLTRANNVISLDLGWSPAVESQAFDRVHRVGQTKRVLVQRIVIAGTVEDRILEMQQRKQTLADGSLGEGSGKKIGKLSVRELANLFGLDRQGHRLQD